MCNDIVLRLDVVLFPCNWKKSLKTLQMHFKEEQWGLHRYSFKQQGLRSSTEYFN